MNILEINERMRQRPPFQMIERVTELDPGKSATGIKCVSINEPYFVGHMPGYPIMPGVLLIETCAQLCSLVIEEDGIDDSKIYVLLKTKDFKFVKAVIPGDKLEVKVSCLKANLGLYEFDCKILVDGQIRAKGVLMFTSVDKESVFA